MPLMPAFHRRKKDSAVIGRLIAGYGELEFLLAMCTGVALAARRKPNPKHTKPRHRIRHEHIGIKRWTGGLSCMLSTRRDARGGEPSRKRFLLASSRKPDFQEYSEPMRR